MIESAVDCSFHLCTFAPIAEACTSLFWTHPRKVLAIRPWVLYYNVHSTAQAYMHAGAVTWGICVV